MFSVSRQHVFLAGRIRIAPQLQTTVAGHCALLDCLAAPHSAKNRESQSPIMWSCNKENCQMPSLIPHVAQDEIEDPRKEHIFTFVNQMTMTTGARQQGKPDLDLLHLRRNTPSKSCNFSHDWRRPTRGNGPLREDTWVVRKNLCCPKEMACSSSTPNHSYLQRKIFMVNGIFTTGAENTPQLHKPFRGQICWSVIQISLFGPTHVCLRCFCLFTQSAGEDLGRNQWAVSITGRTDRWDVQLKRNQEVERSILAWSTAVERAGVEGEGAGGRARQRRHSFTVCRSP